MNKLLKIMLDVVACVLTLLALGGIIGFVYNWISNPDIVNTATFGILD